MVNHITQPSNNTSAYFYAENHHVSVVFLHKKMWPLSFHSQTTLLFLNFKKRTILKRLFSYSSSLAISSRNTKKFGER